MKSLKVITFSYHNCSLDEIGLLVLDKDLRNERLNSIKHEFNIEEMFYIATCNRVEIILYCERDIKFSFVKLLLPFLNSNLSNEKIEQLSKQAIVYMSNEAVIHLMRVSCSLESIVLGEKEILSQVRQMYEECRKWNLTGDFLRLLLNQIVKTSKEVYTKTKISDKPISVVSIAYRLLLEQKISPDTRFIIVGAGETIQLFGKYLKELNINNVVVFNRTLSNAQALADKLSGQAYLLSDLQNYNKGFDVLITCTGAVDPIITTDIYDKLLNGCNKNKTIIDLAIPNDVVPEIVNNYNVNFISLEQIQDTISKNINERKSQYSLAEEIIYSNKKEFDIIVRERKIELSMSEVSDKIKEYKRRAFEKIYAEQIKNMTPESRQVLEDMMNYMEKKYISIPMVMAKDIILKSEL